MLQLRSRGCEQSGRGRALVLDSSASRSLQARALGGRGAQLVGVELAAAQGDRQAPGGFVKTERTEQRLELEFAYAEKFDMDVENNSLSTDCTVHEERKLKERQEFIRRKWRPASWIHSLGDSSNLPAGPARCAN